MASSRLTGGMVQVSQVVMQGCFVVAVPLARAQLQGGRRQPDSAVQVAALRAHLRQVVQSGGAQGRVGPGLRDLQAALQVLGRLLQVAASAVQDAQQVVRLGQCGLVGGALRGRQRPRG